MTNIIGSVFAIFVAAALVSISPIFLVFIIPLAILLIYRRWRDEQDSNYGRTPRKLEDAHNSADFLHDRVIGRFPRTNADLRGAIDSDGLARPKDDHD